MEDTHIIKFADGTELTVTLNGNNYISAEPVSDHLLDDVNLIGMTIDGEEQFDMTCCNHFQDEEGDHIIFRRYTAAELQTQHITADIDYLLMLVDED